MSDWRARRIANIDEKLRIFRHSYIQNGSTAFPLDAINHRTSPPRYSRNIPWHGIYLRSGPTVRWMTLPSWWSFRSAKAPLSNLGCTSSGCERRRCIQLPQWTSIFPFLMLPAQRLVDLHSVSSPVLIRKRKGFGNAESLARPRTIIQLIETHQRPGEGTVPYLEWVALPRSPPHSHFLGY